MNNNTAPAPGQIYQAADGSYVDYRGIPISQPPGVGMHQHNALPRNSVMMHNQPQPQVFQTPNGGYVDQFNRPIDPRNIGGVPAQQRDLYGNPVDTRMPNMGGTFPGFRNVPPQPHRGFAGHNARTPTPHPQYGFAKPMENQHTPESAGGSGVKVGARKRKITISEQLTYTPPTERVSAVPEITEELASNEVLDPGIQVVEQFGKIKYIGETTMTEVKNDALKEERSQLPAAPDVRIIGDSGYAEMRAARDELGTDLVHQSIGAEYYFQAKPEAVALRTQAKSVSELVSNISKDMAAGSRAATFLSSRVTKLTNAMLRNATGNKVSIDDICTDYDSLVTLEDLELTPLVSSVLDNLTSLLAGIVVTHDEVTEDNLDILVIPETYTVASDDIIEFMKLDTRDVSMLSEAGCASLYHGICAASPPNGIMYILTDNGRYQVLRSSVNDSAWHISLV